MNAKEIFRIIRPGQTWVNTLGVKLIINQTATQWTEGETVLIGEVYHATLPDGAFGPREALVTPEGLASAGYALKDPA